MEKVFIIYNNIICTYKKLYFDLQNYKECKNIIYIKGNNPYYVFLNIIHSILFNYEVTLVDGDYTSRELVNLGITQDDLCRKCDCSYENSVLDGNFIKLINDRRYDDNFKWSITLFTSGTTGLPKKITHSLKSITRNVRVGLKYKDDVWGYAYNSTHMAGLQVFFQAFLNYNKIVDIFDYKSVDIANVIDKEKITNISATSTYYKSVIPIIKNYKYDFVKRITFGGEKLNNIVVKSINHIFPNSKITNIYASTEVGTLFSSNNDVFTIPNNIKSKIKINDLGELLISKTIMGKINISSNLYECEEWYNTRDVVKKINENSFVFVSRNTDYINVGGYKVNINEVEDVLYEVEEVQDVLVYSRKNSVVGNIIVAEIILNGKYNNDIIRNKIMKYAKSQLQLYKVPRIINFVNKINITKTGKKVRK